MFALLCTENKNTRKKQQQEQEQNLIFFLWCPVFVNKIAMYVFVSMFIYLFYFLPFFLCCNCSTTTIRIPYSIKYGRIRGSAVW